MELACGYRPENKIRMKRWNDETVGFNSDTTLLVIKLPNAKVLRVMSRSLFFAMVILALPSIGSVLRGPPSSLFDPEEIGFESISSDLLRLLFRDLADEGLLRRGHKALIASSGIGDLMDYSEFLNENAIDLAIQSDLHSQSSIPDETFDLVFTLQSGASKFLDRVLKVGGIVVMELSDDPSNDFHQQSNYKIVYLRRFNSTVVAMRKTGLAREFNSAIKLQGCGVMKDVKKAALKGLEDPLLEPPPRRALASDNLKKPKFLPDLLGDSLESYSRRILLTDDNGGSLDWFYRSYPMKNQHFEVYNLDIEFYDAEKVNEMSLSRGMPKKMTAMTDWLTKNVREDDFVVMKAEAQVVEAMLREKTLCLVDELFLECKNQWQVGFEESEGKRAYWECLALFGRLRDEGIAVHQWWASL